jgi:hypothetical protein
MLECWMKRANIAAAGERLTVGERAKFAALLG